MLTDGICNRRQAASQDRPNWRPEGPEAPRRRQPLAVVARLTWFPTCYTFLVEYVVKPSLNTQRDEAIIANVSAGQISVVAPKLLAGMQISCPRRERLGDLAFQRLPRLSTRRTSRGLRTTPTHSSCTRARHLGAPPHRQQSALSARRATSSRSALSPQNSAWTSGRIGSRSRLRFTLWGSTGLLVMACGPARRAIQTPAASRPVPAVAPNMKRAHQPGGRLPGW